MSLDNDFTWMIPEVDVASCESSLYGVILVDIRTAEVQVTLLYLYLESMAEFGVVRLAVYHNA